MLTLESRYVLTLAQSGGNIEGHFQSLLSIEAGVAVSVIAGAQISFFYASASSNTLCTHIYMVVIMMIMLTLELRFSRSCT